MPAKTTKKNVPVRRKSAAVCRKPATKKKEVVQVDTSDKSPQVLAAYPLEDILGWRDTVRKRIQSREERLGELSKQHTEIIREALRLDRKLHSDLTWCKKLNRVIARKVF